MLDFLERYIHVQFHIRFENFKWIQLYDIEIKNYFNTSRPKVNKFSLFFCMLFLYIYRQVRLIPDFLKRRSHRPYCVFDLEWLA